MAFSFFVVGCDPLTVHKVTTTIFDGVPSLPAAEEYCKDYHIKATLVEQEAERKKQSSIVTSSSHPPYADKRCNDCHNKDAESGFVVAANVLCFHCHKNFPIGDFQHGPVAVGSCLKCHMPHSSNFPSLLTTSKDKVCDVCHIEQRAAKGMHSSMIKKGVYCTDCHDPHGGSNRFFLK
jgi:predicted CXXCH cytochrome family protein